MKFFLIFISLLLLTFCGSIGAQENYSVRDVTHADKDANLAHLHVYPCKGKLPLKAIPVR